MNYTHFQYPNTSTIGNQFLKLLNLLRSPVIFHAYTEDVNLYLEGNVLAINYYSINKNADCY